MSGRGLPLGQKIIMVLARPILRFFLDAHTSFAFERKTDKNVKQLQTTILPFCERLCYTGVRGKFQKRGAFTIQRTSMEISLSVWAWLCRPIELAILAVRLTRFGLSLRPIYLFNRRLRFACDIGVASIRYLLNYLLVCHLIDSLNGSKTDYLKFVPLAYVKGLWGSIGRSPGWKSFEAVYPLRLTGLRNSVHRSTW